jgi:S1/P1 Nuclease
MARTHHLPIYKASFDLMLSLGTHHRERTSNRYSQGYTAAVDSRSRPVICRARDPPRYDTHDPEIPEEINVTRLRNEATALRNRQEFQRSQLTELANTDFEPWAKESFEIATKIAYRNGGQIGIPRGGSKECTMVAAAPVLPVGYVVNASRIADRRMMLAGYRMADLLMRVS